MEDTQAQVNIMDLVEQIEEREKEKEREGREKAHQESSPEPPHTRTSSSSSSPSIAARVNLVHPRPSSCFSRQDKAVDTNRVAIGTRTKPYAPPEFLPLRAREVHAPPPDHRPPPQLRRRRRPTYRSGVHLSSWSSYIPLLFIAKVRATPLNPELV
ncbi:hypothetical protein F2Q69_00053090 [Brassica cretica]|uniref:Uncharacterized protein n=1 Tax=Brassica cretica TaxID=69181 RepID=A0A8S9MN81_BRACR|nr:hypothetical protein F2Q69_00053090 [Brassica cretica]